MTEEELVEIEKIEDAYKSAVQDVINKNQSMTSTARVQWYLARSVLREEMLEKAVPKLISEVRKLREQIAGHCERIAAQSELLTRKAMCDQPKQ